MAVSERFSNGKTHKNVRTVGELVAELSRLPADTPVHSSFERSADVVLYNASSGDAHVEFEDGESWD
jgi:hypothetical protein